MRSEAPKESFPGFLASLVVLLGFSNPNLLDILGSSVLLDKISRVSYVSLLSNNSSREVRSRCISMISSRSS